MPPPSAMCPTHHETLICTHRLSTNALLIYHSPRRRIRSRKEIACEMDSQSYSYEIDGLAIKPAKPNRWGNSTCVLPVE